MIICLWYWQGGICENIHKEHILYFHLYSGRKSILIQVLNDVLRA